LSETPLRTLFKAVNSIILVKLKDGREFVGRLQSADNMMNMILIDAVETANNGTEKLANYGTIMVRGNNILYVVLNKYAEM